MSGESIPVLPVAASGAKVRQCLEQLAVELTAVGDCREAREYLARRPAPAVVITATSLPDGNWCDVLAAVVRAETESAVVVWSAATNERLWSEVIWRGAYDLLVEPLEVEQVRKSVEGASRSRVGSTARAADSL